MAIKNAWKIDPSQSKIAFKVGYMQIGVITGEFRVFNGLVECDDSFEDLEVTITVDSRSVTTFHPQRDEDIRAAGFFDSDNYPFIYFASTAFQKVSSGGLFELTGLLTIRDNTVPIQAMVSLAFFTVLNAGGSGVLPLYRDSSSNGLKGLPMAEACFKYSGELSCRAFELEGPADQESVADEVEFFGEMRIRREL